MKITTASILLSILSLVLIWRSFISIKRETMGIRSGIAWILMWGSIGFFSLFPELLNKAMALSQMKNRMFFILIFAVFILFVLVFNLSSQIDNLQRNIIKLAREIAKINYQIENNKKEDKD